ncbi:hypothetical protein PIB30_061877 [Stylosanthes scabra]|uniref:Uncharacterized protein n=1 Tax=Stylosanthes scabra TaxID=79078 RepID=A0ABU6RLA2_9FABA|nr:hypothetical protein [Stylosanthes scabra]
MLLRLTVQRNELSFAGDGILTMTIESTKGTFVPPVLAEGTWLKPTTFDSGEPYLGLILSNRRVREVNRHMSSWPAFRNRHDRLVALVIPQAGNLRFSPSSSYTKQDLFSPLSSFTIRPIAPFSPRLAAFPSSSTSSGSVGSVHRERSRSPRTPLPPMVPAPVPGPVYPVSRTPMCDARRYRSLFPRRRVAPPTPPPPLPPPSDEEPSAETYDPAAELVGDPDEPFVAERVLYGAPRLIIQTFRMDRSARARVLIRHPLATILPVVPLVACL